MPSFADKLTGTRKRWRMRVTVICLILAAAAVCAGVWLLPAMRRNAASMKLPPAVKVAADELMLKEPEAYTVSWFKEGNVRAEGEPWLVFEPSVTVDTETQSVPFWHYALGFMETTEHTFALDRVSEYIFWAENEYHRETVPGTDVWKDADKEEWEYGGSMPVQDILCSGFLIVGHDEAGHQISFRSFVDFSDAPRE